MIELTLQTMITVSISLVLGGLFTYVITRYKGQKTMVDCNSKRLDQLENAIFLLFGREIRSIYNKYKSKRKIPDDEIDIAEAFYKVYAKFDDNGIMKTRMETMRAWATNDGDKE